MDADKVLWAELAQRRIAGVGQLRPDEVVELALRYAVWIPVDTYLRAPWLAPYAVRKIRIRTDPRAPGPKRDLWGFPDANGYFTDDNSLIKGVFRNRTVASTSSPYGTAKFTTGLVCCHVWAGTTTDPLLFSFVPNLVWLPRTLAPFSDAHQAGPPHVVHHTLKRVSTARYRAVDPVVAAQRAETAWGFLEADGVELGDNPQQQEFAITDQLVNLVNKRLDKLATFLRATLDDSELRPARFSKRYHAGFGSRIDPTVWPAQQAVPELARRRLLGELEACRTTADGG